MNLKRWPSISLAGDDQKYDTILSLREAYRSCYISMDRVLQ